MTFSRKEQKIAKEFRRIVERNEYMPKELLRKVAEILRLHEGDKVGRPRLDDEHREIFLEVMNRKAFGPPGRPKYSEEDEPKDLMTTKAAIELVARRRKRPVDSIKRIMTAQRKVNAKIWAEMELDFDEDGYPY